MAKAWLNIKNWIKKNPLEFTFLLAILAVGAFLRLYRISEYMTFLGDEGRDVIVVRRFLVEGHPMLIGPGTSVGNMYLGPLYYYMMAPALILANFSPVGPAVMIALLGVATIFFVWYVAKKWFHPSGKVAWGPLAAALLYAISPAAIIYSRSSWNPNIMPFFALLSIYSIWKVWHEDSWRWLIILGVSYAFVLQSHYLGLLLIPTFGIFWLAAFLKARKLESSKFFVRNTIYATLIFLVLMSPLVIFDARHQWRNFTAMRNFVINRERSEVSFNILSGAKNSLGVFEKLSTRIVTARNPLAGKVFTLITAASFILLIIFSKRRIYVILFSWIFFGIVGLGLYQKEIFDHYFGFLFPAPFLLLGVISQETLNSKYKIAKIILILAVFVLVFLNLQNSPVLSAPTVQMQRAMSVAKVIQEKANGERFNLATISDLNNRDVYQYFLVLWGAKVVDTDPSAVQYTVTDQLFVVCERPREKCDPIRDPSAWITNFGWTRIVEEWPVWGGTLFKLGHAK